MLRHLRSFLPLLLVLAAVYLALGYKQQLLSTNSFTNDRNDVLAHLTALEHSNPPGKTKDQFVRRIVAVGDIHGDYDNALKVLQMSRVVNETGDWSGLVDYFVQTGDMIDRGDDTIKLYMWMERLRHQARNAGGEVFSHLGNHEWMNLLGDWRYVHESEISTFGSTAARQKMLASGRIGKAWRANYTVATRIPLHPSLGAPNADYVPTTASSRSRLSHAALSFVHGGLSPTFPHLTPYPSRINEIGNTFLRRLQTPPYPLPHPPHPYSGLPADATPAEHALYGADGPVWYRGWALESEGHVCGEVDGVVERIGVRRLIMGHTPDMRKIVSRCGGKIIIIDTGLSHAYGGELSALSITYTLTPTDEAKTTWTEREFIVAIYPDRQEVLAVDEREVTGDYAYPH